MSSALALLSDRRLGQLVDDAPLVGQGIGGTSAALDVGGVPVFVKRVPLTDRERLPENVMSTANMFRLPPFCQYGVTGPGFGTWRELAANALTTSWVLSGRAEAFPLMYHWRVLPGAAPLAEELADVERMVGYWGGSPAVRDLYFADLGLATSPRFDLCAAESAFVLHNWSHDVCYPLTQLVNWLVSNVCGMAVPAAGGPVARNDDIRRCAADAQVVDAPAVVATAVRRYARRSPS